MVFNIQGKIALISGGASGIGLHYAKALLREGLKGVTLADINVVFGKQALEEIKQEFGEKKAIFVQTDVTNKISFEEAFKKTIEEYSHLDILINNAGILNDAIWEKEIQININGVIYGTLLGLEEYIPKYKSGAEGVIVNISSIAGIAAFGKLPVYTGSKFFVFGASQAFGDQMTFERTKVKVIILCPGVTSTPLITEMFGRNLGPNYEKIPIDLPMQEPQHVALAMVHIIKNASTGTAWVVEEGKPVYEFTLTPREQFAS